MAVPARSRRNRALKMLLTGEVEGGLGAVVTGAEIGGFELLRGLVDWDIPQRVFGEVG